MSVDYNLHQSKGFTAVSPTTSLLYRISSSGLSGDDGSNKSTVHFLIMLYSIDFTPVLFQSFNIHLCHGVWSVFTCKEKSDREQDYDFSASNCLCTYKPVSELIYSSNILIIFYIVRSSAEFTCTIQVILCCCFIWSTSGVNIHYVSIISWCWKKSVCVWVCVCLKNININYSITDNNCGYSEHI